MTNPIPKPELERARECLAHQIAAGVHMMLAWRRMTVAELRVKLAELPPDSPRRASPEALDLLLRAEPSEKVTISFLADVAYLLDCEWDFKVNRLPDPPIEPQLPATE